MTEFLQPVLDALTNGSDSILGALKVLGLAAVPYLVFRARQVVFAALPGWVQTFFAAQIDAALTRIAMNAVEAAEEHGERLAKAGVSRLENRISRLKLDFAKAYILARVPDWLVTDARLEELINSALVKVGLGASSFVKKGVDEVVRRIEDVNVPSV